jgi:type I restriction enzyme S subunit
MVLARAEQLCGFITKGTTPRADKLSEGFGDVPYIKVQNLTDRGELDQTACRTFVAKETHQGELARSKVYPGDVLMNIVGPPLGKVSIVPDTYDEWNMNQAIAVFPALPGFDRQLLCFSLLADVTIDRAKRRAKATVGQFNLTLEICRDLPLPVPPTDEQCEIAERVRRLLQLGDLIEARVERAAARAEQTAQAVLAKAFRGELVPQDPADEPAAVTLDQGG